MNSLYRTYTFEDFARDERFRRWVIDNDSKNALFWKEWLRQNPDCAETVQLAKAFLLALEDKTVYHNEIELERITEIVLAESQPFYLSFWKNTPFRIAASLLLAIGMGVSAYTYFQGQQSLLTSLSVAVFPENGDNYLERSNRTTLNQKISLADGSTVTLYPKSSIRYPKSFEATHREVFLNGKAFFEIAKNPQKPFWVYTQHISAQVLGTSFMVDAFADAKEAKVEVKTGKVSVYTRKDLRKAKQHVLAGVVLTPNQQVAFLEPEERLLKSIVEVPEIIIEAPKQEFIFDEAPVSHVFNFLEKIYGLTVIYDAKTMESCYLTSNLTDESLFDKLDLICKITHSTYEMVDAQIIIHSRGCK
jgi:transmembrane sensor